MAEGKLLFVYNADGGAVSAVVDALHKLVSPQTYDCALCAITHGAVSMRREWKDYVGRLPYPCEFLHRDEFRARWPEVRVALPAILLADGAGEPTTLVGADDMRREQSVAELIATLERALAPYRDGQAV